MKISIVTVSYNSQDFIAQTIESVLIQDYKEYEYIIVDGNSTDATVQIAREYEPLFLGRMKIVSEPDAGIYDAMNKGIHLATGDVVGFLNSDDAYTSSKVLTQIAGAFKSHGSDVVYGDLVYVDRKRTRVNVRVWKTGDKPAHGMRFGWHPPHPTIYVRKLNLVQIGGFQKQFRISADYAQMLQLFQIHSFKWHYIREVLVSMKTGGESNRSLKNIIDANRECFAAWEAAGLKPSFFLIPLKLLLKIKQRLVARWAMSTIG